MAQLGHSHVAPTPSRQILTLGYPLCHLSFPGGSWGPQLDSMPKQNHLEVELETKLESVDDGEDIVQRFAQQHGFTEEDVHQIGMAVRESLVNAVVHGNCYNSSKKISLTAAVSTAGLTITVQDQGLGFDVNGIPDPRQDAHLLSKTGRGLFLIRAFMDELHVQRVSPEGLRLVMIKNSPTHDTKEEG